MRKLNQEIKEALKRWTDKIYPSKKAFEDILSSGKKLIIYHGVDPTSPHLHLGHSTNFFLLEALREIGCKIILLIGDFTAQIGDPTGRSKARKALTKKQILLNYRTYRSQAGKILDFSSKKNPVQIKFNSQWLNKLKMAELIKLASFFTHGQMIKRNMFQERLKRNEAIYLSEFLYPIFQGYDSVALNADAEVGGTDQTFNMLIGRELMKIYGKKEKFVITTPLLINPKTKRKLMSKSEGGIIALDDKPNEMYGKIMALPDETIIPCFRLCTKIPLKEIEEMERRLKFKEINPRDLKASLAREIVTIYYGRERAKLAEEEFNRIFRKKKLPFQIPTFQIREKTFNILDLLLKAKLVQSKSEAKRLIFQKGIKLNGEILENWKKIVPLEKETVIQVGKRKFLKVIPVS